MNHYNPEMREKAFNENPHYCFIRNITEQDQQEANDRIKQMIDKTREDIGFVPEN